MEYTKRQIKYKNFAGKDDIVKLSKIIVAFNAILLVISAMLIAVELRLGFIAPIMVIALVCGFGAIVSMVGAWALRNSYVMSVEQQEILSELELFNNTLRAQRHDFNNHIQVVSALLEMEEYQEARHYLGKVTADIQSASASARTAYPAVNALLAAKQLLCEKQGVALELDIQYKLEGLPIESWELCRMIGNLIDNAVEAHAAHDALQKYVRVSIYLWQGQINISVANNGPKIPEADQARVFFPNYSTKGTQRGMGLTIVQSILNGCEGDISLSSTAAETSFLIQLPIEKSQNDI